MWVFKYKFDSDGFLAKFKARLCVRGDLQHTEEDTYAATLSVRTFRALMAVSAAFDLEIRFTNSELRETVHCVAPEGFRLPGHSLLAFEESLVRPKSVPASVVYPFDQRASYSFLLR
jgi:hypothetical protein